VKRFTYFILFSLLLVFLQVSVLPRLLPEHFKPDLLLILVLYVGITVPCVRGGLTCWYLGCLEDVFAGSDFGLFGITFLIIFLTVRAGANRFNTESSLLLLLLSFVATFLKGLVLIALLLLFADAGPQWTTILSHLLPEAILNTICAFLLLKLAEIRRWRWGRTPVTSSLLPPDRRHES